MDTKKGKEKKTLKFVLHLETMLKPDKEYGYRYVLFGSAFVCDVGSKVLMKSEIFKDIGSLINYVEADGRSDKHSKGMKTRILKSGTLEEADHNE
jgi:hypothetical protein